ncbi:MAG: sugar ABC transporter permease [Spirochaetaceae bacterium]|jgi:multiple sugar transport system permease protein|nr:sugar ABC transporter permease [Spirochaetaceae bacterium]
MSAITQRRREEAVWGLGFIIPTVAGLVILNIIPIFQTVWQSFFKVGDFGRGNMFVGLRNYLFLLKDRQIWQALFNTFAYAVLEVPLSIILALILAIMLNRKIAGRAFFRTIFFLPMVAAPAAVAMVWRWLYNGSFGLINFLLSKGGAGPVNWISSPDGNVLSVAIVGIWSCLGYNMVLFLAGLQEIPRDYYEAAEIDGAGLFRRHAIITLPLLSPIIYFVGVTRTIAAMQVFDLIFMMMDRNNPALPKTQSLVYLFYKYSFVENNKGYGAAIVMMLLLIILLLTGIQQTIQKRWVHYS